MERMGACFRLRVPWRKAPQGRTLTENLPAEYLLADRGYDINAVVPGADAQGMEPVIPSRNRRK